jgi:superfamily II DNA/RNA helicase
MIEQGSGKIVNVASTRHDGLRLHVVVVRFPPPWAHVGSARRLAMEQALNIGGPHSVLFSTDAGGLGLNLQDAASVVVNLEVPWNPAVLEQRIGRVHRMGQRKSVQVLHFVTRGAIEERVRQVVENKKALFDGLLVDEVDRVVLDEAVQASFVERVRNLLTA